MFNVIHNMPVMVADHEHTSFMIYSGGSWVGSGINVETPDGRRLIRIFDYDEPLQDQLKEYFSARTRVSEVTFTNPHQ